MVDVRVLLLVCFFFFKQKTAYEMRISDWSSDVCSSDLMAVGQAAALPQRGQPELAGVVDQPLRIGERYPRHPRQRMFDEIEVAAGQRAQQQPGIEMPLRLQVGDQVSQRSEERRVGIECVSPRSARRSPEP